MHKIHTPRATQFKLQVNCGYSVHLYHETARTCFCAQLRLVRTAVGHVQSRSCMREVHHMTAHLVTWHILAAACWIDQAKQLAAVTIRPQLPASCICTHTADRSRLDFLQSCEPHCPSGVVCCGSQCCKLFRTEARQSSREADEIMQARRKIGSLWVYSHCCMLCVHR